MRINIVVYLEKERKSHIPFIKQELEKTGYYPIDVMDMPISNEIAITFAERKEVKA